ncbi:hypothetical protein F511_28661 [Dorcoceras hygrometricum]|uniref:Uncharacterized protein n=1 Tax=Dorcoceras hygrometricum TaxID=472368 RepID=A0A2Z7C2W6_9LAMI|nr:hypothetical protein F511_28661 [Dorcoceras hygrometricum]
METPEGGLTTTPAVRAACGRYSACVRRLQCLRAVATVPASTTGNKNPSSAYTRIPDEFGTDGNSSTRRSEQVRSRRWRHDSAAVEAAAVRFCTCVTLNGSGIQLAVGPQPLWLRNRNFGLAQRIMYGPFNTYIPIRSTTIGKSRVSRDPITMHTSWRSKVTSRVLLDSIGYPRVKASGESSTTKHRLLHASGPHPIPPPNDPKTNQYNQDLGLIHSTNGNHLESPNEGSSIDHQVTINLHAQNITMFPTNETCRSYSVQQMKIQQIRRGARYGMSCDDISLDICLRCSLILYVQEQRAIAAQLLFTEPYLLRLPVVEDSDWSKSGSAGLLLPRRLFLYHFRRLGLSWKKIAKEDTLCSLLAFRQICFSVQDMVTPASKQDRGFAVQICIILKGAPDLDLGESKAFPPLKILTAKTVGTYVAKNKNITVEEVVDEPVETVAKKAATKRRPAPAVVEPAANKKRTTVGRAAPAEKNLAIVTVAQDVEPISVIPAVSGLVLISEIKHTNTCGSY